MLMFPKSQVNLWYTFKAMWERQGHEQYPNAEHCMNPQWLKGMCRGFSMNWENVKEYILQTFTHSPETAQELGLYPFAAKHRDHWGGVLGMVEAVQREALLHVQVLMDQHKRHKSTVFDEELGFLRVLFNYGDVSKQTHEAENELQVLFSGWQVMPTINQWHDPVASNDSRFRDYMKQHGWDELPVKMQHTLLQTAFETRRHPVQKVFANKQEAMKYVAIALRDYFQHHLLRGVWQKKQRAVNVGSTSKQSSDYKWHPFERSVACWQAEQRQ